MDKVVAGDEGGEQSSRTMNAYVLTSNDIVYSQRNAHIGAVLHEQVASVESETEYVAL